VAMREVAAVSMRIGLTNGPLGMTSFSAWRKVAAAVACAREGRATIQTRIFLCIGCSALFPDFRTTGHATWFAMLLTKAAPCLCADTPA